MTLTITKNKEKSITKINVVLFFIFIHLVHLSHAQSQQQIDSLELQLQQLQKRETPEDSLIINTTYQLSRAYWHNNPNKALMNAERSLMLAKKTNYPKGIGNAYHSIGVVHVIQGDFIKALLNLKKSLKIREQINDKHGISASCNLMGYMYAEQGNDTKALENYRKALMLFKELKEELYTATVQSEIGAIYTRKKEYVIALDYNQKALRTFEKLKHHGGIASVLNNIGQLASVQGKYDEALKSQQKALHLHKEVKNKLGVVATQIDVGKIFIVLKNYSKAITNCSSALEIATKLKTITEQKNACECLYNAHKSAKNLEKALLYNEQLSVLRERLDKKEVGKKLQQMEFQKQVFADSIKQEKEKLLVKLTHIKALRKKENQRNLFLGMGISILLLAISLWYRLHYIRKSKTILQVEKDRSENLLLNILPSKIAKELKEKGKATAQSFDNASILFTDFDGFTQKAARMNAEDLVKELNCCFKAFDKIIEKYGIEKIKTIGDAYMAVGGLPIPSDTALKNTISAALEMQSFIANRKKINTNIGKPYFEMRTGIHTGSVVAGIVGTKKFQYDIWGDAVNTAARVESAGFIGKVNISQSSYDLIKEDPDFVFETRGNIKTKGKGEIAMYFVMRS